MIRALVYLLITLFLLLLQTSFLPFVLPLVVRPELPLIFIVYLCVAEDFRPGALAAWLVGCLLDIYSGIFLGLHAFVYLAIFVAGRSAVQALNSESPLLLLLMVFCGSVMQALLLVLIGFFADLGGLWLQVSQRALFQGGVNVVAAYLLLELVLRLKRRYAPRLPLRGLDRLESAHGD